MDTEAFDLITVVGEQPFRLSALQKSLLWEALSLLIITRARALELAVEVCRRQGNAAPDVLDFHLPAIIELQRQFGSRHD
ncbi:hypothetical protein B0G81_8128 [Paraburkholderia sp. BL6665CI2N2]|uniref:hypothetical protein n=1 Tax=Paraburkholderia sp. BL6665CI2N2 TaxID=1938806 RepID=UPI00106483B7|nr:hypothetical protein [Paraburkholderia sp. BL6665CI2N2]TDY16975.1 hypothetical protein B0G81_8128 [Paraburkholderia sp. BL6665CI2N2]